MIRSLLSAGFMTCFLMGCGSFDKRPLTGLDAEPSQHRAGTAISLLNKCPVSSDEELPVALIAAVVPLLADFAVSTVGKVIEGQKEGLSGQFVAGAATTNFVNDISAGGCLAIYRGLFGETNPTGIERADGLTEEDLKLLSLADYPAFYMEAETILENDALKLEPRYIRYAQSSARNDGSGRKHVGIALAVTERALKRDEDPPSDKDAIALFRFDLGRLEIGKSYLHKTDTAPILTGTGSVQSIDTSKAQPANLLAYVVESESPGIVLEALSAAFKNEEKNLKSALGDFLKGLLPKGE